MCHIWLPLFDLIAYIPSSIWRKDSNPRLLGYKDSTWTELLLAIGIIKLCQICGKIKGIAGTFFGWGKVQIFVYLFTSSLWKYTNVSKFYFLNVIFFFTICSPIKFVFGRWTMIECNLISMKCLLIYKINYLLNKVN